MRFSNYTKVVAGFLTIFLFSFLTLVSVQAAYNFGEESGIKTTGDKAGYDVVTATSVEGVIGQVVLAGLSLVGIAFLGFLIYGGITWMTARDNEEKVKKANAIIMAAILGLIVTLAAYVLTYFLVNYFYNALA